MDIYDRDVLFTRKFCGVPKPAATTRTDYSKSHRQLHKFALNVSITNVLQILPLTHKQQSAKVLVSCLNVSAGISFASSYGSMLFPDNHSPAQWAIIEKFMPEQKPLGRNIEVNLGEVLNAILYTNRSDCQCDMLPHSFPNFKTVNDDDNLWRSEGRWDTIMHSLRDAVREAVGRKPDLSND